MPMYPKNMFFTSESVTEGHPDKLCDQVSDAVLDECLRQDPQSRVACNTYVTLGMMIIGGEITTKAMFNVDGLVRKLGNEIGYSSPLYGYDVNTGAILRSFHPQSPDIDLGVSRGGGKLGAGDQGMMFGYACRQTPELMPLPIMLAHRMAMRLAEVRKQNVLPFLGPDGKSQVTLEYRDGKPVRADYVVLACQHTPDVVTRDGKFMTEEAKQQVFDAVARPVLGDLIDARTKFTVNGTGKFLVGGPRPTPVSPGARSLSTLTAAGRCTAAAPSAERTRRKWIARPGTWRATSPRMSSPPGSPTSACCSWAIASASSTLSP